MLHLARKKRTPVRVIFLSPQGIKKGVIAVFPEIPINIPSYPIRPRSVPANWRAHSRENYAMVDRLERNKTMVREYYDLALNKKKPEEAVAKYLGPYYRQHNPGAADGAAAFVGFVQGFVKAFPNLHFEFRRFVAEGDLVVVHSHLIRTPGERGVAVMDIFRIDNDRIVEHWDVLQEIPETSANTNTMF